jgi:prevent-host-death family protein
VEASILDLRRRMSDVLQALDRNEPVTISYRGRPKAVLVPASTRGGERRSVASLAGFGMWKDHAGLHDVAAHVRNLRQGRVHGL